RPEAKTRSSIGSACSRRSSRSCRLRTRSSLPAGSPERRRTRCTRAPCNSRALRTPGDPDSVQSLTLTRPDDAHLHLRDGAALASVLPHTARVFARAVVMPNLRPPVTDTGLAAVYRGRTLKALPKGSDFEPLMTLYLTDNTSAEAVERAKRS